MISEQKLDNLLLELGHDDFNRGTSYIREGVKHFDAGKRMMTKELYPAIAKAHGTTPARVERMMRHSIEKAWGRNSFDVQLRYFGQSVDPNRGKPTVGEYLARVARLCHEN